MKGIVERVNETQQVSRELCLERPPFPRKLKVELTARCDLRCGFCSLTYKPRTGGDMDQALFAKIVCEANALGVSDLGLFWLGEPLLVERLEERIAFAKAAGIPYVFITTNGRTAIPDRMRRIIDSGIDSIKFSFNASSREQYRAVTGVDAFDRVVDNIRATWALRGSRALPKLYASTVVDPGQEQDFEAAHALIGPYVDQHYPLRRYGADASRRGDARTLDSMLPCWSLFTEAHVSWDGQLSACFCDHDQKFHMGDLRSVTLLEAWHSPTLRALRSRHLAKRVEETPCAGCIAYAR